MPGFRRRPPWPGVTCGPGLQQFETDRMRASRSRFYRDKATMVVIRLARGGANKRPFYNIVVADSRLRRDGRFIERLGFYNPVAKDGEEKLRVAQDRLTYWRGVGAQASPTVERLFKQAAAKTAA